MDMTQDRQARAEKIGKLLAKAERAGTEEEAEAFFAKAQELMTQWTIDELEARMAVDGSQLPSDGELGKDIIWVGSSYAMQDVLLVQAVGRANDCKTLWGKRYYNHEAKKQQSCALLYGYELDRLNVKLLYQSLLIFVTKEALKYGKQSGLRGMDLYIARRSFREAFASRIERRLFEARRSTIAAHEAVTNNPLAPAIVAKKDAVEKFVGRTGKARGGAHRFDYNAGAAGRAAADRADIGGTRIGAKPRGALGR